MLLRNCIIGILLLCLFPLFTNAQTPGGIAANPTAWFKGNVPGSLTLNGGTVSQWNSTVGGVNVAEPNGGQQPTFVAGDSSFNFNPYLAFDGTNDRLLNVQPGQILGSNSAVFTVLNRKSNGTGGGWGSSVVYRTNNNGSYQLKPFFRQAHVTIGQGSSDFNMYSVIESPNPHGTLVGFNSSPVPTFMRNGSYTTTTSNGNGVGANTGLHLGCRGNSEYQRSAIAEIIFFDQTLTAFEMQKVSSYLAVKYGIHLDQGTPQDYLDGNGNSIWTAGTNTIYNHDIAGIGVDNTSDLNQPKSKSVNDSTILTVEAANPMNNADFVTWGNDNAPLNIVTTNLSPTTYQRLDRAWKAQVTNYTGNLNLSFLFVDTVLTDFPSCKNLVLAIDEDGDGNYMTGTIRYEDYTAYTSSHIHFDNIQLFDGEVFTIMNNILKVEMDLLSFTPPSCLNSMDGEINVTSSLGLPTYFYSMNGGTYTTDSSFVGLGSGTYTIVVEDSLGCLDDTTVVMQGNEVIISVSNDTTICENGTVSLEAFPVMGTSLVYNWDFTNDTGSMQTTSPGAGGTYTVYGEDQAGCISSVETIDVNILASLTGTISPDITICLGESTDLTASVSGGQSDYTFTWSTGEVNIGASNNTINVSPAVTTTYTVTITDNCESSPIELSVTITVPPTLLPEYSIISIEECEPASFQLINTTSAPSFQTLTWTVNGVSYAGDTILVEDLYEGTYDILMEGTSAGNCFAAQLFSDVIEVFPLPIADFSYSPNPVFAYDTEVQFVNSSSNAISYEWEFEAGNPSNSTVSNPLVIFPEQQVGNYYTELIAISEHNCTDTMSIEVIVLSDVILYAPNSFTPDGDEHNQSWFVHIDGIDRFDFDLLIFNRWGEVIWESHNPDEAWDGIYNGKIVQNGIYTWTIRTKSKFNDEKLVYSGHINVMR